MLVDCFTFFNELDLLEIRLNHLYEVVDRFVIVEATKTHQFKDKPLFYEENKQRFEKFADKIVHVIVDSYPENPDGNTWIYEHHQRNAILEGLKDLSEDVTIMISDLDEIPSHDSIKHALTKKGIRIFRQDAFYYYINCLNASEQGKERYRWNGTIMLNIKLVRKFKPQYFREMGMLLLGVFRPEFLHRNYYKMQKFKKFTSKGMKIDFIKNGGWHFSYLGGVEAIIKKIESFAHNEYNKPEFKDPETIKKRIAAGEDIFGRGFKYQFLPIDHRFPEYIQKNKEKYPHLIFTAE